MLNEKLALTENLLEENPYKKMLEEAQEQIKEQEKQRMDSIKEIAELKVKIAGLEASMEKAEAAQEEQKNNYEVLLLQIPSLKTRKHAMECVMGGADSC